MKKITPIVLAAGKGSRIGQSKWQLMHEGQTFLSIIVNKLLLSRDDTGIICIARKDSLPQDERLTIVVNEHPEQGMLSSVYLGIQANKNAEGYLVWPVDHPFVSHDTIGALIAAFDYESDSVICPSFEGRSGHPIIIPAAIAQKITMQDFSWGLKQILLDLNAQFCYVAVEDSGILKNINRREDLI